MSERYSTGTLHAGTPGAREHEEHYEQTYTVSAQTNYAGGGFAAMYVWTAPADFRVLGVRCATTPQGGLLNQDTNIQLSVGGWADSAARIAEWNGLDDGVFGDLTTGGSRLMTMLAKTVILAGESVQLTFGDGQANIGNMGITFAGIFL